MKDPIPQIQDTKLGGLSSGLAEKITGIPQNSDGRHPLNIFEDNVQLARMQDIPAGWPMPYVTTTEEVIRYYNKGTWEAYKKDGFFTYKGVLVCEEGKEEELKKKLARSLDIMPQVVGEPGTHKPATKSA